jgi:adenosylmethionine-8-amino-7-oxononanoate aminotransferase
VERVRTEGELFKGLLRDALGDLEAVGDIRGRGFFVGVEFVADRSNKVPFDHNVQLSARINNHALSRGLLCYAVSGNVDGTNGDAVILAPPYIASRAELMEIVRIFADCTIAALRDIGRA